MLAALWFAFSPIEERRRQEGEEDGSFTCSAFTTHSLRPLFCHAELHCASDADTGLAFVIAALGAPALQRAALPGQRTRGGGPAALVSLFASFIEKHSRLSPFISFWALRPRLYVRAHVLGQQQQQVVSRIPAHVYVPWLALNGLRCCAAAPTGGVLCYGLRWSPSCERRRGGLEWHRVPAQRHLQAEALRLRHRLDYSSS